jgi:hypothetical protein
MSIKERERIIPESPNPVRPVDEKVTNGANFNSTKQEESRPKALFCQYLRQVGSGAV